MMKRKIIVFLSILFFSICAAQEKFQTEFQNEFDNVQKKLGVLDPWQVKIFKEEVIVFPERFIKNYTRQAQGLSAEVDIESIRGHLKFSAKNIFKGTEFPLIILFDLDQACTVCLESEAMFKSFISSVFERRAFKPVWIENKKKRNDLDEFIIENIAKNKAMGGVFFQFKQLLTNEDEAAHEDEARYLVSAAFHFAQVPLLDQKFQFQVDTTEVGNFNEVVFSLLAQAFLEFNQKLDFTQANQLQEGSDRILLEVSGVKTYKHLTELVIELQNKFMQNKFMNDKVLLHKISPGRV
ncbi:MAG: hypothetical protein HY072_01850, partial [Deltaproteobacteria bacterium]|nr:hypothetical protein [Deltaproteobacteria bacterium]